MIVWVGLVARFEEECKFCKSRLLMLLLFFYYSKFLSVNHLFLCLQFFFLIFIHLNKKNNQNDIRLIELMFLK
jgi:hypothetical protein